jgi:hypothetical protein
LDLPIPRCYGVLVKESSISKAFDNKDPCEIEIEEAEACAPGWNIGLLAESMSGCKIYNDCVESVENGRKSWGNDIPKWIEANELNPNAHWELPKGWDKIEDVIEGYEKYSLSPWAEWEFYGSVTAFHDANGILLGVTLVGVVFLTLGVVMDILGREGDGDSWLRA